MCYVIYRDRTEEEGERPERGRQTETGTVVRDARRKETVSICAPAAGTLIPVSSVNDPTFAEEMLGKGAAVIPEEGTFYSPVNGKVQMVFDMKHAIGFLSGEGAEVLLHVGLDTVSLKGKFFETLVQEGQSVKVGTPVLRADLEGIRKAGYETTTLTILTNHTEYKEVSVKAEGKAQKGEEIIRAMGREG